MHDPTATYEAIRPLLLPRLQHPQGGPARPFSTGPLEVGLVVEGEVDIPVTWADLEDWSVSFDDAYAAALDNLRDRSHTKRWQDVATVPGMQIYLPGGGDAAARALLLQELLETPVEGVLFAVPTPDQLLAVPLRHLDHLEAVKVLVTAAHLATQGTHSALTDQIFWLDGDEIVLVPVVHGDDTVDILAPPELLAAVERLAAFAMVPQVAEA